jgi:anti-sigma B factor antagonist
LGVLINLRKKTDAIKGRVVICSLRGEIKKAFKITRLDKLFDFYDNEEKALASFGISTTG